MKMLQTIITVLLLATFSASTFAAPTNGPKPRCPAGELPTLKNGHWVCAPAKIKAPGATQRGTSTTRDMKFAPKRPERARPDLSIANILKQDDKNDSTDTFKAYVKNTGPVQSAPCKMSLSSTSGGGDVSVPSIPAKSGKWIEVKFFAFKKGSRIKLYVDSTKKVNESNEKNNKRAFNW